ncbi:STAS domain-containing protein [bacterium]|nr:STAS domain-containing protein [bacterium]
MSVENKKSDRLKFEIEELEKIIILKLVGDLDMYTLPFAKEKIKEILAESKVSKIIMDLGKMDYIDSSGLGFFIGTLKKLRDHGGDLKLLNLNSYIKGIFRLIQLDFVIEICESREVALEKLK